MTVSITLKDILLQEAETVYTITEKLFHKVTDADLFWTPPMGTNWMTMGQLLMHCAGYGCGKAVKGFVTGVWEQPEDVVTGENEVNHIPPASDLPSVKSVQQALGLLNEDRDLALRCINNAKEDDLLSKRVIAPWGGPENTLFQHLQLMIKHLEQHKGQLFYYLKLMGEPVNSTDLWGD